jgi:hypothetical protein
MIANYELGDDMKIHKAGLFDTIKNNLRPLCAPIVDFQTYSEMEKKLIDAIEKQDVAIIKIILTEIIQITPKNEVAKELLALITSATSEAISSSKSMDDSISEKYVDNYYYNFEINRETNKKVLCVSDILNFDICKKVATEIADRFYTKHKEQVFPFIVSPNKNMRGRVVQCSSGKQNQILVSQTLKGRAKEILTTRFIGESHPLNSEKFEVPMYTYTFVSSDNVSKDGFQTYTLLSRDFLPMDELEITGMEIPIKDSLKIGNTGSIEINTPTVFVINYSKTIKNISHDDFKLLINNYNTHDKLFETYFSILRQPNTFEKFLLSMMFCAKGTEGYPSHVGLFGPAGCGKSKIIEAITGTFGEVRLLETTTIKSIVPNFGGNRPEPGLFIKSKRFCTIDEFLNLIVRADKVEEMRLFNSLLTHAEGVSGSGKHTDAINARPTATMVFVSNYIKGRIPSFVDLCEKVDVPFLSRFILYSYTPAHEEFIRNREEEVFDVLGKESRKVGKTVDISSYIGKYVPEAIQITDYLKSQPVIYDNKEVTKIYNEVKEIIPEDHNVAELYNSRSRKHISAILDGTIKYHYIVHSREGPMDAQPEDYELTKEIWYMIVGSWTSNYNKMPHKYRIKTLTEKESAVYHTLKKQQGLTLPDLEAILEFRVHTVLLKLIELGLIKETQLGAMKGYTTWDYEAFKENISI